MSRKPPLRAVTEGFAYTDPATLEKWAWTNAGEPLAPGPDGGWVNLARYLLFKAGIIGQYEEVAIEFRNADPNVVEVWNMIVHRPPTKRPPFFRVEVYHGLCDVCSEPGWLKRKKRTSLWWCEVCRLGRIKRE